MRPLDYNPFPVINLAFEELQKSPKPHFLLPFVRYLLALAECKQVKTVVIGQEPYGRPIYPFLGAAFAYEYDQVPRGLTPSVEILREYVEDADKAFSVRYGDVLVRAFAESYKLLYRGYVFINATFAPFSPNGTTARQIVETAALLRSLTLSRPKWGESAVEVICFGTLAEELGHLYASSINRDVDVQVVRTVHPAYLARLPLSRRRKLGYFKNARVLRFLENAALNFVGVERDMSSFSFDDLARCLRSIQFQMETRNADVATCLTASRDAIQSVEDSSGADTASLLRALKATNEAVEKNGAFVTVFSDALSTVLYVLGSKVTTSPPTASPPSVALGVQSRPAAPPVANLSGLLARPEGVYEPESEEEEEEKEQERETRKPSGPVAEKRVAPKPSSRIGTNPRLVLDSDSESESEEKVDPPPEKAPERREPTARSAGKVGMVVNVGLLDEAPHVDSPRVDEVPTPPTSGLTTPRGLARRLSRLIEDSSDEEGGKDDEDVAYSSRPRPLLGSTGIVPAGVTGTDSGKSVVLKVGTATALVVLAKRFRTDPKVLTSVHSRYDALMELSSLLPTHGSKVSTIAVKVTPALEPFLDVIANIEKVSDMKSLVLAKVHPILTQIYDLLTS